MSPSLGQKTCLLFLFWKSKRQTFCAFLQRDYFQLIYPNWLDLSCFPIVCHVMLLLNFTSFYFSVKNATIQCETMVHYSKCSLPIFLNYYSNKLLLELLQVFLCNKNVKIEEIFFCKVINYCRKTTLNFYNKKIEMLTIF